MVFILSQRYGPPLVLYGNLSATHCEYNEAKRTEKKILFYIRNALWSDFSAWKKNGKPEGFRPLWAAEKDALGLYKMIEDHVKLTGEDGQSNSNNWRGLFVSSVDLRADIRKRLNPQVTKTTAERMILKGEVPLLVLERFVCDKSSEGEKGIALIIRLHVLNVGPMQALNVTAYLEFASAFSTQKSHPVSVLLPISDWTGMTPVGRPPHPRPGRKN